MLYLPKTNLIVNGDFESGAVGTPPDNWVSVNTLTVGRASAFTGAQAASLGETKATSPAVLFQDVPVIPLHRYQLTFQLGVKRPPDLHSESFRKPATAIATHAGDLIVEVRWMDSSGFDVGPGLHAFIPGTAAANVAAGLWDAQVFLTGAAPLCACIARVLFTRSPGTVHATDPSIIDAVAFADVA